MEEAGEVQQTLTSLSLGWLLKILKTLSGYSQYVHVRSEEEIQL